MSNSRATITVKIDSETAELMEKCKDKLKADRSVFKDLPLSNGLIIKRSFRYYLGVSQ